MKLTVHDDIYSQIGSGVLNYKDSDYPPDTNPIFKFEPTVSDGYTDITSIENIINYISYSINTAIGNPDYKIIRRTLTELKDDKGGFDDCTANEKKILTKFFASGNGTEYNDGGAYWSESEYDAFLNVFDEGMRVSRIARDEAITRLLQKKIRKGLLAQSDIEVMMLDAKNERERYRIDGHEGLGYGDSKGGYFDYIENTNSYSGLTILAINTSSKKFTVSGLHQKTFVSREFVKKEALVVDGLNIRNSTGNDGIYTIDSVSDIVESGGNTDITVVEAIPDTTVDGIIYHKGFLSFDFATTALKDELMIIYKDGVYQ